MANVPESPKLLYSISQVNAITGVPKTTIRFWEKEFIDFLNPQRTVGNQRRYDAEAVELIKRINQLVNEEGYTLEGARRKLEGMMRRRHQTPDDPEGRLNELAETMSDYLLQKLFDRAREEEARRQTGLIAGKEKTTMSCRCRRSAMCFGLKMS